MFGILTIFTIWIILKFYIITGLTKKCETRLTLDFTRKLTLMTILPTDITESRDAIASKSITDIDGLSTSRIYFSQNEK